jgi:hypothetical protein
LKYNDNGALNLREFRFDDVQPIVNLFNETFSKYIGFVPRTSQYWIWSNYKRPDVTTDGIRVMALGNKVVGYIVVGRSGNIWDMCYNLQLPEAEAIVHQLVSWAIDYSKNVGSDSVQLNFPMSNRIVRKVCNNLNFSISPPEYMFLSVLDFHRLISETFQNSESIKKMNCQVEFKLRSLQSPSISEFGLSIKDGNLASLDRGVTPEFIIETDQQTLVSLILRGDSILMALLKSKLKFVPYRKTMKCIKLLTLMQNKSKWFMPRADIG